MHRVNDVFGAPETAEWNLVQQLLLVKRRVRVARLKKLGFNSARLSRVDSYAGRQLAGQAARQPIDPRLGRRVMSELVSYGNLEAKDLHDQLPALGLLAVSAHVPFVEPHLDQARVISPLTRREHTCRVSIVIQDAPEENWSTVKSVKETRGAIQRLGPTLP